MSGTITILCGDIHKGKAYELYKQNSKNEQLDALTYKKIDFKTEELQKFFEISDTEVPKDIMDHVFYKIFGYQYLSITCLNDPIFTSIHIPPKIKIKLIIEIAKKCRDFDRNFCIATNDSLVLDTLRVCVVWGIIDKEQLKIQFYEDDTYTDIHMDKNGTLLFQPTYFFSTETELSTILVCGKSDTFRYAPSNRYIKYLEDKSLTISPLNNNQESEKSK